MQRDSYNRPWIRGDEPGPADLICFRCGEVPYTQGSPWGATVIEETRAADIHRSGAFALCSPCAIAMHEWLHPEMATSPRYLAAKDQHMASLPDQIRAWNDQCMRAALVEGAPDLTRGVEDD